MEEEFLIQLIYLLKHNKISLLRAKTATKELLSIPFNESFKKINSEVKNFVDKYPEFKDTLISVLTTYEKKKKEEEILKKMEKYIKVGKIDEALQVAKKLK